jgi:hypothetical protein
MASIGDRRRGQASLRGCPSGHVRQARQGPRPWPSLSDLDKGLAVRPAFHDRGEARMSLGSGVSIAAARAECEQEEPGRRGRRVGAAAAAGVPGRGVLAVARVGGRAGLAGGCVAGRRVAGRAVTGRAVTGRAVTGRVVTGRAVTGLAGLAGPGRAGGRGTRGRGRGSWEAPSSGHQRRAEAIVPLLSHSSWYPSTTSLTHRPRPGGERRARRCAHSSRGPWETPGWWGSQRGW